MKAAEWIDRVKSIRGWESDYRVAKELELSKQLVSAYRTRPESTMDDDTAIRVARALQLEPEIIMIDQAQERAKSDEVRKVLRRVLARLGVKPPEGPLLGAGGAEAPQADGGGRVDITSAASTRRGAPEKGPRSCKARGIYIASSSQALAQLGQAIARAFFGAPAQFPQSAA